MAASVRVTAEGAVGVITDGSGMLGTGWGTVVTAETPPHWRGSEAGGRGGAGGGRSDGMEGVTCSGKRCM